jgi:hypothetical protein
VIRAAAAALAVAAGLAVAEVSARDLAEFLAAAISGAEACGYTVSEEAIEARIRRDLPADDTGFVDTLQAQLWLKDGATDKITATGKTAYCAALRLTVERQGLLAP